jgi:hypothetical protein
MDEKVFRLLHGNFINYAAVQLTIGNTRSSFKNLLPEIVNEKFNFNENEIKNYLSNSYPNFLFYVFNPWVYAKDLWESRFVFDLAFSHKDGINDHVFYSTADNRVECGIHQISSVAKNRFFFVYYRYKPDNVNNFEHDRYSKEVREISNKIREQNEYEDSKAPVLNKTSIKIRSINPTHHCWNFVVFANEHKDPVIKSIITCPTLSEPETHIQNESKFKYSHWWSYFVDKYNYYCTFAQFDYRYHMRANISVSKFQFGYDIGNLEDPLLVSFKETVRDMVNVSVEEKLTRLNNLSVMRFHDLELWEYKMKIMYEFLYQISYDTKTLLNLAYSKNDHGKKRYTALPAAQALKSSSQEKTRFSDVYSLFSIYFLIACWVIQP